MSRRPFFIGIAGGSCSGKTTLASALAERLRETRPVAVVPLDSYYHDLGGLSREQRASVDFDLPSAIEDGLASRHLEALAAGLEVRIPLYRFDTHERAPEAEWETLSVDPTGDLPPVVIVEGLYTLYFEPIREMLDLSVFVDADHTVCLERRIERDTRERGRTPEEARRRYLGMTAPMYDRFVAPTAGHADMVVDGTAPPAETVARIEALLPLS